MSDEELRAIGANRLGDRIALRVYCKTNDDTNRQNRENLIGKLRSKMESCKSGRNSSAKHTSREHLAGNKFAKKNMRRIEIGWMQTQNSSEPKQVRSRRGGGTRKVLVDCAATMRELMNVAKNLFFPNGVSAEGKVEDFAMSMAGFDGNPLSLELTVEELYNQTKVKLLRIYMLSEKNDVSSNLLDESLPSMFIPTGMLEYCVSNN